VLDDATVTLVPLLCTNPVNPPVGIIEKEDNVLPTTKIEIPVEINVAEYPDPKVLKNGVVAAIAYTRVPLVGGRFIGAADVLYRIVCESRAIALELVLNAYEPSLSALVTVSEVEIKLDPGII
jgi:hypothetical protein